jgi:MFS superfamily sulfate permease-like transporter
MVAVALIAARLLKLGFIADFLSRSVLVGFLTGVGIQVAMGQLAGIFGVSAGSGTTLQKFAHTLQAIAAGQTNVPTLVLSVVILAVIVGLERVNKKIPGALIAVVGAIAASYLMDFAAKGITVLGPVPGGLPQFGLPQGVLSTANVAGLLPVVAAMFLIIIAQSAATSRAYAMRYNDAFEENIDLVGLSLANAAAGLSGTFVVNGSPTKTEMVDGAGGRSQIAQLTTAAIVLVVLLFLTGPLAFMPNAVLASIVFLIGLRLVDLKGMSTIARLRREEFLVALLTALTVVVVGVEQGIILAIVLSIIVVVRNSYKPHNFVEKLVDDGRLEIAPLGDEVQALPGLIVYHFGASLYYANSAGFTSEIVGLAERAQPPLRWLALGASAMGDIDYTGAAALGQVLDQLQARGVTLALFHLDPLVRQQLDAYGLTERIGADHIFVHHDDMLAAYRALPPAPDASP